MNKTLFFLLIANFVFLSVLIVSNYYIYFLTQKNANFKKNKPLVILLDNSGSMGVCAVTRRNECVPNLELPYRIEVAKTEVIRRIMQPDFTSTKIGLVEFGNYRSYGLDKSKACSAVQVVVSPEVNNQKQIFEKSGNITANDDGKTPVAYAINFVVDDILTKQNLLPANILLITDGQPNCEDEYKYNMCYLVNGLAASKVDLDIWIFGYKARGNDSQFIECAKRFPNMVHYFPVDNQNDLYDRINEALPLKKPLLLPEVMLTWGLPISGLALIIIAIPIIWQGEDKTKKLINVYTLENVDDTIKTYKEKITMATYNVHNYGQIGAVGENSNATKNKQNQHMLEREQTLSEAANEIQKLLKQLEKTNPNATDGEKIIYVNERTTPHFKSSILGAVRAGGEAAIEQFLDNPYVNIVKAIVKGWMEGWVKPN